LKLPNPQGGWECIGYGEFLRRYSPGTNQLVENLRSDVAMLQQNYADAIERMVALQNVLIDLLDVLDPNYLRFPKERRLKVSK